jgi:hypothetical protein
METEKFLEEGELLCQGKLGIYARLTFAEKPGPVLSSMQNAQHPI